MHGNGMQMKLNCHQQTNTKKNKYIVYALYISSTIPWDSQYKDCWLRMQPNKL